VTTIPLKSFALGNNGFVIISCFYIYLGASAAHIHQVFKSEGQMHSYQMYLIAGGFVFVFSLAALLVYLARKELSKMMAEEEGGGSEREDANMIRNQA